MFIFKPRHRDIASWWRSRLCPIRHQTWIGVRLWVGHIGSRLTGKKMARILLGTSLGISVGFGFGFLDVALALEFGDELLDDVDLEVM